MAGALGSQVDVNIYARRREMMGNVLSDAGYEFQMPKGAFYFFPKAPGGDDVAFVNKLLDERILAVPGSGFGGPGHFRLAFCVEDEVIARSCRRLQAGPRVGKPFRAARRRPVSAEPWGKWSTGTASSWCPMDGFRPAGDHFPGLAITYLSIPPPNASRAGRGFPRFSSPFKKTRGLPCVLRDISRDWKPHQNLRDGNVFPWGGLLRFSPS